MATKKSKVNTPVVEDVVDDAVVAEIKDASTDTTFQPNTWAEFVKQEMIGYLNQFLPASKEGVIGIRYVNPVSQVYEGGTVYDKNKAIGVQIITEFSFEEPIDITKTE